MDRRILKMSKTIDVVIQTISEVLKENGAEAKAMSAASEVLRDTGLDSLALAEVVVRLEERFQKDPFQNGFIHFRTIEELSRLYEN